ncbi:hypothetical protein BDY19DRAFT_1034271 [Irpex rosettiformis]|uniref:Uncharacterized protein n=1 Tax=Irpex rosettiformis TaxID=378272 RepID=A0ACB8TMS2_9APHY|nr:hypothetical protein BDY19DRAFT_1034271 [Irpex rosettiformis]
MSLRHFNMLLAPQPAHCLCRLKHTGLSSLEGQAQSSHTHALEYEKLVTRTLNGSSGLFEGITNTQTASMLCALAIGDYVNGSTTSKHVVIDSLNTRFTLFPNISQSNFRSSGASLPRPSITSARADDVDATFYISRLPEGVASGAHPSGGTNVSQCVMVIADDPTNISVNGETSSTNGRSVQCTFTFIAILENLLAAPFAFIEPIMK